MGVYGGGEGSEFVHSTAGRGWAYSGSAPGVGGSRMVMPGGHGRGSGPYPSFQHAPLGTRSSLPGRGR